MKRIIIFYYAIVVFLVVASEFLSSSEVHFHPRSSFWFLLSFPIVLYALIYAKTYLVLRMSNRHCNDGGLLKRRHSWYLFMHYAYNTRFRFMLPYSIAKPDFRLIDRNFAGFHVGESKGGSAVLYAIPLPTHDKDCNMLSISMVFDNSAGMLSVGVLGSITAYCLFPDDEPGGSFCAGVVLGVLAFVSLRIVFFLVNASRNALQGRYADARRGLYFLALLFPIGTIFAFFALRMLNIYEAEQSGKSRYEDSGLGAIG